MYVILSKLHERMIVLNNQGTNPILFLYITDLILIHKMTVPKLLEIFITPLAAHF